MGVVLYAPALALNAGKRSAKPFPFLVLAGLWKRNNRNDICTNREQRRADGHGSTCRRDRLKKSHFLSGVLGEGEAVLS